MQKEADQLNFSPIEQRYVASCYPLPDREGYAACMDWRSAFAAMAEKHHDATVELSQLAEPFPHLTRLALTRMFRSISIQDYFEGLDFPETSRGLVYHNPGLYLFAKRVARTSNKNPAMRSALLSVLDHVSGCSVKPALLSEGLVMDYSGVWKKEALLVDFLKHDAAANDYLLVHGKTHTGAHIGIRMIDTETFEAFTRWFHQRAYSKENPFLDVATGGVVV